MLGTAQWWLTVVPKPRQALTFVSASLGTTGTEMPARDLLESISTAQLFQMLFLYLVAPLHAVVTQGFIGIILIVLGTQVVAS